MKTQLMQVLRKTIKIEIDVKAGSRFLLEGIIEPKLQKFVDKTSNPFDNIAMATLMPEIKNELIELTGKANTFINGKIQKLLGLDEAEATTETV